MSGHGPDTWMATCSSCGKRGYTSRKAARRAAKNQHPGDHLQAYRCDSGLYHYGHPARYVMRGIGAR